MNVLDPLCRTVRPHFSAHLDGVKLPLHVAIGVALHRAFCPWCRRTYASLEQTREALRALRDAPASGEE